MIDLNLLDPSHGVLIGGQWRAAGGGGLLPIEDPSTGAVVGELAAGAASDVDEAVEAAQAALDGEWGALTAAERGRILSEIGRRVAAHGEDLARLEAMDVGKPLRQARADVVALARYLEFYGGAADKLTGETIPFQAGYTVMTLREPHGVTGHIIPWNYPLQIIGRSVVGALAAGNATVLKPAEEASVSALAFARIAQEAGLPVGALNLVPGLGETAGAAVSRHPDIRHVSFTGSPEVGALVQKAAADRAAPVTLELGGKSPQIVFDDADLDEALPFLINGGLQNAGQTCSAASRILVQRGVYDQVVARMSERYRAAVAAPAMADRDLGPLITARQRDMVKAHLHRAAAEGLTPVATGLIDDGAPIGGHYVAPALYAGIDPRHALAQLELFGPVQVVIPFEDEDEAIRIANGTAFGLVAGAWTADGSRALRLARRLRAGQVFINNYGAAGGVELPFGGVGLSGHGREKGFEALRGFTVIKTVAIRHG